MALHTQDPTIQWITAIFISFYGERAGAVLTAVTLEVKVLVESYHSDRLLTARSGNNGFIAAHTKRRETSVVILDTVGVVIVIGDEGCALKYAGAGAAAETVGVETLSHCLEHTVGDPLSTSGTHSQRAHVAVLALRRAVSVIELHALQGAMAAHATEAAGVKELVHGSHSWLGTGESLATLPTHLCRRGGDDRCVCVHVFYKVLGHSLQLLDFSHVQRNATARDSNWTRR